MSYPIGIENARQRIEEIRAHIQEISQTNKPESSGFQDVLDSQIQQQGGQSLPLPKSSLVNVVESEAQKIGLDPNLAKAIAQAESGFNPNAVSKAGAQGLMQLMPSTAQGLGVKALLDPVENVQGGTRYLKSLLDKYHSIPKAVAAYNAGPGAVDKYNGIPPYTETQNYVRRVLQYEQQFEKQNGG